MNWNPYLLGNVYLGDYGYLNTFTFAMTIFSILMAALTVGLYLKAGFGYSVQDTEAHAVNYAGVIREGHGGMTIFLWLLFAFMLVWTIVYFVQHAGEFAIWFAY